MPSVPAILKVMAMRFTAVARVTGEGYLLEYVGSPLTPQLSVTMLQPCNPVRRSFPKRLTDQRPQCAMHIVEAIVGWSQEGIQTFAPSNARLAALEQAATRSRHSATKGPRRLEARPAP